MGPPLPSAPPPQRPAPFPLLPHINIPLPFLAVVPLARPILLGGTLVLPTGLLGAPPPLAGQLANQPPARVPFLAVLEEAVASVRLPIGGVPGRALGPLGGGVHLPVPVGGKGGSRGGHVEIVAKTGGVGGGFLSPGRSLLPAV